MIVGRILMFVLCVLIGIGLVSGIAFGIIMLCINKTFKDFKIEWFDDSEDKEDI